MKTIKIACNEIKTLAKNRFVRLSTFVVVLIPLLYGVLYLWAFWDPYKNMSKVPVAIVNNDQGATKDATKYNFGDKIVDNLKNNDGMAWKFVSQAEADKGLNDKKYYVEIIIPNNFSKNVLSVDGAKPTSATLQFKARQATNLLASQLTDSAAYRISETVGNEISKNYFDNIFVETRNSAQDVQKAADGAGQLADGLKTIKTGSSQLVDGAKSASDGSAALATGMSTVSDGSSKLALGANSAYSGSQALTSGINNLLLGSTSLNDGLNQTLIGAKTLDSGIASAATGAKSLAAGSAQVKGGISQVNSGVTTLLDNAASTTTALQTAQIFTTAETKPDKIFTTPDSTSPLYPYSGKITYGYAANYIMANDARFATAASYQDAVNLIIDPLVEASTSKDTQDSITELKTGLARLSEGDNQLDTGINNLNTALNSQIQPGSTKLVAGLSQLSTGSQTLESGLGSAKTGSSTLNDGLAELSAGSKSLTLGVYQALTGSQTLSGGLADLSSGANELNSGINKAQGGASTLSKQLSDGAKTALDSSNSTKTDKMSPVMAAPVKLADISIDKVPNYGTGFAPYFIPLALWVGSLILFLIIKTNETIYKDKATKKQITFSKYLVASSFGTLQAIVMDAVLILALHLSPVHPVLFFLFTILTSWCFVAILQFLVSIFGDAGKFIGIVLLMLQLTSAAGTFPLETAPKFFQIINPYLPMTYVVSGLREVISGDNLHMIGGYLLIMALCGLAFIFLTLIFNRHIYQVEENVLVASNDLAGAQEI